MDDQEATNEPSEVQAPNEPQRPSAFSRVVSCIAREGKPYPRALFAWAHLFLLIAAGSFYALGGAPVGTLILYGVLCPLVLIPLFVPGYLRLRRRYPGLPQTARCMILATYILFLSVLVSLALNPPIAGRIALLLGIPLLGAFLVFFVLTRLLSNRRGHHRPALCPKCKHPLEGSSQCTACEETDPSELRAA